MEAPQNDFVVREFLKRVEPLRSGIEKIILFGSRARGTAAPWSDYDFLIVVPKREQAFVDSLYDAVVFIQCETGKDLSLKIVPHADFERGSAIPTPFLENVLREGIILE